MSSNETKQPLVSSLPPTKRSESRNFNAWVILADEESSSYHCCPPLGPLHDVLVVVALPLGLCLLVTGVMVVSRLDEFKEASPLSTTRKFGRDTVNSVADFTQQFFFLPENNLPPNSKDIE